MKSDTLQYNILLMPGYLGKCNTLIRKLLFPGIFLINMIPIMKIEPDQLRDIVVISIAIANLSLIGVIIWRFLRLRRMYVHKEDKLTFGNNAVTMLKAKAEEELLWDLSMDRELRFAPIFSKEWNGQEKDHYLMVPDGEDTRRIDFLIGWPHDTRKVKHRIEDWVSRGANIRYISNETK